MEKLQELSAVIKRVFAEVAADDARKGFNKHYRALMVKPLVRFAAAYDTFIASITNSPDSYDLWLSVQMRVLTALGSKDSLRQLEALFFDTMTNTEGGDICDCTEADFFNPNSRIIALAFRVYLDDFPTEEIQPPEVAGGKA